MQVAVSYIPAGRNHPANHVAFEARGAVERVLYDRSPEIVVAGAAGTGKTRGLLEKLHLCAQKYAGMRGLIVRKTRKSLTQTAMVTFENFVLPPGTRTKFNTTAQEYRYPNGSIIAVAGMDKSVKIMSAEFDLIYVAEATELLDSDWEALTTRLRNGVMPYQQIIGDCNPDSPTHWIRKRASQGALTLYESIHEDNPMLWNGSDWTERGQVYLSLLDRLTGVRKERLRWGRWVQAEGIVWQNYSYAKHVIDPFPVPDDWDRFWAVDFGYVNPFVWQEWAVSPDNVLYLIREIYRTKRLVEDHATEIRRLTVESPRPRWIVCDHDAEDRATLERHLGLFTLPAHKGLSDGLQAVDARFKPDERGKAGLYIFRDALVEEDPELRYAKKPVSTVEEIDGYVWDLNAARLRGERVVKENDHGCDAMRYAVAQVDIVRGKGPGADTSDIHLFNL